MNGHARLNGRYRLQRLTRSGPPCGGIDPKTGGAWEVWRRGVERATRGRALPSESGGECAGHCTSWRDGHGCDLNTAAVGLESDSKSTFKNGAETCGQVFLVAARCALGSPFGATP
jgi:hypothetical protein